MLCRVVYVPFFFFFNDTATTEIYTLSLHDALPISLNGGIRDGSPNRGPSGLGRRNHRSEEHTSELQSHHALVCRLLLEKKKKNKSSRIIKARQPSPKQKTSTQPRT